MDTKQKRTADERRYTADELAAKERKERKR